MDEDDGSLWEGEVNEMDLYKGDDVVVTVTEMDPDVVPTQPETADYVNADADHRTQAKPDSNTHMTLGAKPALGAVLAVFSAVTLAISMGMQQIALKGSKGQLYGWEELYGLRGDRLWVLSMLVYLASQGFFFYALTLTTQVLVAACFSSVIAMSVVTEFILLRKLPKAFVMVGICIILVGVTIVAITGPTDHKEKTHSVLQAQFAKGEAKAFCIATAVFLVVAVAICSWLKLRSGATGQKEPDLTRTVQLFLYPAALGTLEMIGAISTASFISLCGEFFSGGSSPKVTQYIAVTASISFACSISVLIGLRKVYEKFTTAEALPIEYGWNTLMCLGAGLVLFGERENVKGGKKTLFYGGLALIPLGILVILAEKFISPSVVILADKHADVASE